MKSKILKELKNADDYISGQQLCERLGVSRTAVWKHIKALRAEGYEIDSVTNKGYKLVFIPDGLGRIFIVMRRWILQTLRSGVWQKQGPRMEPLRSQRNRRWGKAEEAEAGLLNLEQALR